MRMALRKWEYGMLLLSLFFVIFVMFLFWPKNVVLGGDDIGFHLNRILSLSEALDKKTYPFYISSHFLNGYGYAANWFYPDVFLLPIALFLKFGGSITTGYKFYLVLVQMAIILVMYSVMFKTTNRRVTSWIVAWLYVFSSYRLIDQYVRSALGENLAFLFYPIVVSGIYQLLYKENRFGTLLLVIGFTGLVYTHILSVIMMFVVILMFCLICFKRLFMNVNIIRELVISAGVTVLLSSFVLAPMIEQMVSNEFYYQTHPFATLSTGTGYSIRSFLSSMITPYMITPQFIVGIGLGPILILLTRYLKKKSQDSILLSFATASAVIGLVFLIMETNLFPIHFFSILDIVQFSWRFNAISTTLLLFSGGIYLSRLQMDIPTTTFYLVVVGLFIILSFQVFQVNQTYQQKYGGTVDTYKNENYVSPFSIGVGMEYMPASGSKLYFKSRGGKVIELISEQSYAYQNLPKGIQFTTDVGAGREKQFELPLIFYKGYEATIDGRKIPISEGKTGLILIKTEKRGVLQVKYVGTWIQKVSLMVSISMFLIIIGYYYIYERLDENGIISKIDKR